MRIEKAVPCTPGSLVVVGLMGRITEGRGNYYGDNFQLGLKNMSPPRTQGGRPVLLSQVEK